MKKFLPAVLANLSAVLSEILLTSSAAWLITSAAPEPPLSTLSVGITLVRAAGISRAGLRYADRFLSHRVIFEMLDELREKLYRQAAEKLPLKSGILREGEFLRELTVTADTVKDFLPRVILPLATGFLTTVLMTGFLFGAIEKFAFVLPAIFFASIILSATFKFDEPDDSDYRSKISDFYSARDELKIYGTFPAVGRLNRAAEFFGKSQLDLNSRKIFFDTALKIFDFAGLSFILFKLCEKVGRIEFAVWIFVFLAIFEIYSAIPESVRLCKKIRSVNPDFTPEKKILPEEKSDCAVEFRDVNFGYIPENPIIKNFNLKIRRGEFLKIVGESGAGKTTLLYLMTKLFEPDKGIVLTQGKISAATFTNYIFSNSIRENFKIFVGETNEEKIREILKICLLENFDLDENIGEDGAKLSGGERGRLQIALALAKNPDIFVADEPTAGLDKKRAEILIRNLANDCTEKNRTFILITHDSTGTFSAKNFRTVKI